MLGQSFKSLTQLLLNPKQNGVPALPFKDGVKLNFYLTLPFVPADPEEKNKAVKKISKVSYLFYGERIRVMSYKL
jgi:hypothetical protein